MQTSKLLENRKKTYILDVICNRFYSEEVQEQVLSQCSGQGISAPRTEGLSVYQWSVPEKKQVELLVKHLCKYSPEVSWFALEIWKNRRSWQMWVHKSVLDSLKIPRPKKRTSKLCVFYVDHPCKFHAFPNSLQEIPHELSPAANSMSSNLLFGVFLLE